MLPWEHYALRGQHWPWDTWHLAASSHPNPGARPSSLPMGATGTTCMWLEAQPSGPLFQESGVLEDMQTLLPAVCPGGLAPLQLTGA